MKKTLTYCAPGSGRHETYGETLKLSPEANKWMSKRPQLSFIALNTPWHKDHSVDTLNSLDSLSACLSFLRPWEMGGT